MNELDIVIDFWAYIKNQIFRYIGGYIIFVLFVFTIIGTLSLNRYMNDFSSFFKYKVFRKTPPSEPYYTISIFKFIYRLIFIVCIILSWIYFMPIVWADINAYQGS